MNPESVRQRIEQLLQQTPFAALSADMRLALKAQLSQWLTSANLVTREEFDVQTEALRRTQSKLEELEAKIALLENN